MLSWDEIEHQRQLKNAKSSTIKCSCGEVFKNEKFATAEAQFRCHVVIAAPGGKLTSKEHTRIN